MRVGPALLLLGLPGVLAAAEYANPRTCAACHAAIAATYAKTGMGRSFYSPTAANVVENYSGQYDHQASGTHYEMVQREGAFYQRRSQTGFDGKPANSDEQRIDFIMGSGNHARTYLHLNPRGALVELPLAWYSEKGGYWAMNPGYDTLYNPQAGRPIGYECMFCHNAYPKIPAGQDRFAAEPLYTAPLPEGIDCQRCHGPAARHVALAQTAGAAARSDPPRRSQPRALGARPPNGGVPAVPPGAHQFPPSARHQAL